VRHRMTCGDNGTSGNGDGVTQNNYGLWQLCYLDGGSNSTSGQGTAPLLCSPLGCMYLASPNLLLLMGAISLWPIIVVDC
jgi:hypothetical protein